MLSALVLALGAILGGDGRAPFAQNVQTGEFPERWIDGTDCTREPAVQVHWYNPATAILRQSLCTNFEGPFLYVLFGTDEALLLDTGASGIDLKSTVEEVILTWEARFTRRLKRLVVAHSHSHGDHVAGDAGLRSIAHAEVVGLSVNAVASFFGISNWPDGVAKFDLSGRILDVIPIPGHEPAHIAIYDRLTGLLLTGDTLYPGRLYFPRNDFATYRQSVTRLAEFVRNVTVTWVLGAHIEMTSQAQVDFPFMSRRHPNEHRLQLPASALTELKRILDSMGNVPQITRNADFIVFPQ